MDFVETNERTMLRAAVGDIARRYGHGYYVEKAHRGEKATELWRDLAGAGFVGVNVPEEDGGGGAGIGELAIVCEELAAAGCPLLLLVVSSAIGGTMLARLGDEAQRKRWLPALAAGRFRMAFALTEPDAGTNTHRLAAVATREGPRYRLRGTKYYTSCADEADAVLVVARTGTDQESGAARLSLLVVDTDAEGLEMSPIPVQIVAPERQFTLFFDDVLVPADRLLGTEGEGLRQLFYGLNPERITGAATAIGIARYALDKAAAYARERRVWDVPIGAHQGLAHPLAAAKIQAELAALMTEKAAWLYDAGKEAAGASNMAKYAAAEAALVCLDQSIQTHGGNGLSDEYGLADLWGLARLLRTAPVSREMILNHVATHALGLPRSY
ncbi:MAG: acyl-CoA dehydrogenase family protein [Streptosporangiaceae bacterium]